MFNTGRWNMMKSYAQNLKELGLDVEFLAWLEGEDDILFNGRGMDKVDHRDLLGAIRAVTWLEEICEMDPEWLSSDQVFRSGEFKPDPDTSWMLSDEGVRRSCELEVRYRILKKFLLFVLNSRSSPDLEKDLESLERVCQTLLPVSSWQPYRDDILMLRKRGRPKSEEDERPRGDPGRPPSERTDRMVAAYYYVSTVSSTPYVDLAGFWNEHLGDTKYDPDTIRQRLRKARDGAYYRFLEWRGFYEPSEGWPIGYPFPPSARLRERYDDEDVKDLSIAPRW